MVIFFFAVTHVSYQGMYLFYCYSSGTIQISYWKFAGREHNMTFLCNKVYKTYYIVIIQVENELIQVAHYVDLVCH